MYKRICIVVIAISLVLLSLPTNITAAQGGTGTVITPENADQIELLAQMGRGRVNDLAWSPNGTRLAVATSRGIELLDEVDLTALPRQLGPVRSVGWIDWATDNTLLSYEGGGVTLWDMTTETIAAQITRADILGEPPYEREGIGEIAVNPSGTVLATPRTYLGEGWAGHVILWDITDPYHPVRYQPEPLYRPVDGGMPWGVGRVLTFIDDDIYISALAMLGSVVNIRTGDVWNLNQLIAHDILIGPDNRAYLGNISTEDIFSFLVPDPSTPVEERENPFTDRKSYPMGGMAVPRLAMSSDGQILIGCAIDATENDTIFEHLLFWDVESTNLIFTLPEVGADLHVAPHPQQSYMAFSANAEIYTLTYGYWYGQTPVQTDYTRSATALSTVNDDGSLVAIPFLSSENKSTTLAFEVWDTTAQTLRYTLEHDGDKIQGMTFLGNNWLLVAGGDHITLWDMDTGQASVTLPVQPFHHVLLSPARDYIALVSLESWDNPGTGIAHVWDVHTMQFHDMVAIDGIETVYDEYFASWQNLTVGDTIEQQPWFGNPDLQIVDIPTSPANEPILRLYGNLIQLVAPSAYENLHRPDDVILHILEGHTTYVASVHFTSDGTRLISVGYDGTVYVWGIPE
jgi:WD40 repeat protein